MRIFLNCIWKDKVLIFAVTLLFLFSGIFYASFNPKNNVYSARASVYVSSYGAGDAGALGSYSEILASGKVCKRAESLIGAAGISAEKIRGMIGASLNEASTVMEITARSENPETAARVADGAAEAFVTEVQSITGSDAIRILDTAGVPELDSRGIDALIVTAASSAIFGFFICVAAVFAGVLFSDKIKSVEQCLDAGEDALGIIPYVETGEG